MRSSTTNDNANDLAANLSAKNVDEVECLLPDLSGVARGKIIPTAKFAKGYADKSIFIAEDIFAQTVSGQYSDYIDYISRDMRLQPDLDTLCPVPWYKDYPVMQVICDAAYHDGQLHPYAPRSVLRKILDEHSAKGLMAVVAPEIEFYLVKKNEDPNFILQAPVGLSGRQANSPQAFSIDAINEFDPVVEDIYACAEAMELDIDTISHESGKGQIEINFRHGEPLQLADQLFLFKRMVRQVAFRHDIYATFMAKPYQGQPGSAMHIHQSIMTAADNRNIFANAAGEPSAELHHYLGGLQRYLCPCSPLICPNINSFKRFTQDFDAPINLAWGIDNRTCGLRVPRSDSQDMRVENRVAGADANPYLAIASTLACGLLGLQHKCQAEPEIRNQSAYKFKKLGLPRHQLDAFQLLAADTQLQQILGSGFVENYLAVKRFEYDEYNSVISSWEREHLLLNV